MHDLIFRHGPMLIARTWEIDGKHEDGRWDELDVTDRAHERLFDFVTMDAAVKVGDIFRLLDASPLLQQVFRRDFAEELCTEARKGPTTAVKTAADSSVDERIEYLELYQQWSFDTSTRVYGPTQRLHLHGIGLELQDDSAERGRKRSERIPWSISLTPLRELLPLSLLVNPKVQITEDDLNAKAYGDEIFRVRHPDVTLGQVIHGVLWELSFHGVPELQSGVMEELKKRVAEVGAGTAELVGGNNLFHEIDRPECDALFDDLGGRSAREISFALRDIDDDENAAAWFERKFAGAVVIKPQFRDRSGREFRKTFRVAGR